MSTGDLKPTTPPRKASMTAGAAPLRARRSPRLIAAGVMLAALGGLGAGAAYTQASSATPVIVMSQTVARGEVVKATDMSVVTLGTAPGVKTVPSDQMAELVGKTALVDLPAGSLVGQDSVGEMPTKPDEAQLGLKLAAGRLPMVAMPAGTKVKIVPLSATKADGSVDQKAAGPTIDATIVTAPTVLPDGMSYALDVSVSPDQIATVARLASQDLVVLVKVGA